MELFTLFTWHIIIGYILLLLGFIGLIIGTIDEESGPFLFGTVLLLIYYALSIIIIVKYNIPFLSKLTTPLQDWVQTIWMLVGIIMIIISLRVWYEGNSWNSVLKGWAIFLLVLLSAYILYSIGSFTILVI